MMKRLGFRSEAPMATLNAIDLENRRGVRLGAVDPARQVRLMVEGSRKAKEDFAARILPLIMEIQATGVKTLQGVADCLNLRGITTRQGCKFAPTQIHTLLKSSNQ